VCWQRESQSGDCYADKSSSLLALSRMVSIPEYVLVQDVADVLAGETPASDRDAWLRRRIEFADRILLDYAKALIPIRSSGLTEHADFPSGL